MDTKMLLVLGVVGVGGFLIYRKMSGHNGLAFSQFSNPNQMYNNVNSSLLTQPSQIYPIQAIQSPRVDSSNQPWYGGSRQGLTPAPSLDVNFAQNVAYVKGAADISESLSEIWNLASGWFAEEPEADDSWLDFGDWEVSEDFMIA